MSDTMEHTVLYKLRYTPVSDFLRGRITARLDLRRPLEEAALPPPVKDLILRVVGRTRLWRLEKLEVLTELIAHFTDGIASGVSPEQLIKVFGDETQAAKLIRRAKRRNRPLPWRPLRVAGWSTAALLTLYFGYALYFFGGRPSPRINYVANLNQAIESAPEEDRAWPLYRRALLVLEPTGRRPAGNIMFRAKPGTRQWPQLLRFTSDHQAELEMIRQGAERPALGFVLGPGGSAYDSELWPDQKPPAPATGQEMASVALPSFQGLRNMVAMLSADASLARQGDDEKRLLRDIHSLLGLSRQLAKDAPLLLGLVSLSIYESALREIERTLDEDPTLIRNENWIALADQLSAPQVAGDLITADVERMAFEDMLQRSYTDDGAGNGRLTPEGVRYITAGNITRGRSTWLKKAVQPTFGLLAESRQELTAEYTRLMDRATANLKLPRREADWRNVQDRIFQSIPPIITADYRRVQESVERQLGHRDGLLVGIALEIFRSQRGKYPDTLDVLVPKLLLEVPADRITGEPVRYRLVDGHPLVYSVGGDRNDDGGRPTARPRAAANWEEKPDPMPDGDWVLYPTPE